MAHADAPERSQTSLARRRLARQVYVVWLIAGALLPTVVLMLWPQAGWFFHVPFLLLALIGGGFQAAAARWLPARAAASLIVAQILGFWILVLTAFTWLMPAQGLRAFEVRGVEWVVLAVSLLGMLLPLGVCWRLIGPALAPPAP